MEPLISFVIYLAVAAVVLYIAYLIINLFPVRADVKNILLAVLSLVALIVVLRSLGWFI